MNYLRAHRQGHLYESAQTWSPEFSQELSDVARYAPAKDADLSAKFLDGGTLEGLNKDGRRLTLSHTSLPFPSKLIRRHHRTRSRDGGR